MPQIQVIERGTDPYAQLIAQTGKTVGDRIQEYERLKLYGMKLAADKRNAETELEKYKATQREAAFKDFISLQGKGEAAAKAFLLVYPEFGMEVMDGSMDFIKNLSEKDKAELDKTKAETQQAITGAGMSSAWLRSKGLNPDGSPIQASSQPSGLARIAAMQDSPEAAMSLATGGVGDVNGQAIPPQIAAMQPQQAAPAMVAPRPANPFEDMEVSYNTATGGMTFKDLDSKRALQNKIDEKMALTKIEAEAKLAPGRQELGNLYRMLDAAVSEVGGNRDTAMNAWVSGNLAKLASSTKLKTSPAIAAYDMWKDNFSLGMTTARNGGRGSDQDRVAVRKAVPDYVYHDRVNSALKNAWNTIFSNPTLFDDQGITDVGKAVVVNNSKMLLNQVVNPTKEFIKAKKAKGWSQQRIDEAVDANLKRLGL